jgi:hypothetical protein
VKKSANTKTRKKCEALNTIKQKERDGVIPIKTNWRRFGWFYIGNGEEQ